MQSWKGWIRLLLRKALYSTQKYSDIGMTCFIIKTNVCYLLVSGMKIFKNLSEMEINCTQRHIPKSKIVDVSKCNSSCEQH